MCTSTSLSFAILIPLLLLRCSTESGLATAIPIKFCSGSSPLCVNATWRNAYGKRMCKFILPIFFRNKTKFSNRINWNTDIRMYMHALCKNMWHPKMSLVEHKQNGCWNETRHFSRGRTVEPGRIDVTYCRYIVINKWHLNLCIEIQSTVNWNSYCVHFTCVNMYKQLHSCAASKIL